ncbi:SRPBCC domain-containing protein [uncultured Chryseobacterium sp.]|uniref:SRPBCC domain-containing protein n=1 Tax=uncultured Chryseobacterium sp. TaxID=259322 RepID=UPI00261604CC|nr:SRPBCC domain-containing protein [uncultured Chryseobacterium sp.]
MKKLEFSIPINATKEKVWEALWKDDNYRNWCAVFHEGSHYESDLKEGSKIYFLGPDKSGMFATIEKMVPYEKMYFLHKGDYKNGVEQTENYGENAIENYDLSEENGTTTLSVTMNAPEDYIPYFTSTFPTALEKVKDIAERL